MNVNDISPNTVKYLPVYCDTGNGRSFVTDQEISISQRRSLETSPSKNRQSFMADREISISQRRSLETSPSKNTTASGGGKQNCINSDAPNNFIGGGYKNCINTHSHIAAIVGGAVNTISSSYSFIGGGVNNNISGNYSAILGGSGNNDSGCSYAGIFGCNITGVADKTLHVNCLNACDTPVYTGTAFCSGTLFYVNSVPLPSGTPAYPLYIWL